MPYIVRTPDSRRAFATVEEASEVVLEACRAGVEAEAEEVTWLGILAALSEPLTVRPLTETKEEIHGRILAAYNAREARDGQ